MNTVFQALGGLALFLLAMSMMTGGLKVFAGNRLKSLLQNWTSTPMRGVLAGTLITGLVQSSSAVTVATIGFVNAGALPLRHALSVVFGANVGTTMTGWLVSTVGFDFKIEAFALPILAVGVALRLIASGRRATGLGEALAGFGLFFLGLSILKESLAGSGGLFGAGFYPGSDIPGLLLALAGGAAVTVVTQSSSAAIAVILTAANEGVIGINAAAAGVIGANVGTTSTAILAVIGATPNAKRVAAGHVAFNLVTGVIALLILPGVIWVVALTGQMIGVADNPAPLLALFHTTFNILGVLVMLPLSGRLASWLERRFRTAEEDVSRPKHLDRTLSGTPVLALAALHAELLRLRELVGSIARNALSLPPSAPARIGRLSDAIISLGNAIEEFATRLRMADMPREAAEEMPRLLRTVRYLDEAASLAPQASNLCQILERVTDPASRHSLMSAIEAARTSVDASTADSTPEHFDRLEARFEESYQTAKSELLRAAAERQLDIDAVDHLLDLLSHTRRMVQQAKKAAGMIRGGGLDDIRSLADGSGAKPVPG